MPSRRERLAEGLRYDPQARRKSQRHGKQRGVTITVAAAELRAMGIDPDGPPPEYRISPGQKRDGGFQGRFYRH